MTARRFLVVSSDGYEYGYAFLANRIAALGQQVAVALQEPRPKLVDPWRSALRHYASVLRRHGVYHLVDLLLFSLESKVRSFVGRPRSLYDPSLLPSLEPLDARVEVRRFADVNSPEAESFVRGWEPDVIVLFACPILSSRIFSLAKEIAINAQTGLIPDYRGLSGPVWPAVQDRFEDYGFTVHRVTEKVHCGDILLQRRVAWPPGGLAQARSHLVRLECEGLVEVIGALVEGRLPEARPCGAPAGPPRPATGALSELRALWNLRRYRARAGGSAGPRNGADRIS